MEYKNYEQIYNKCKKYKKKRTEKNYMVKSNKL